jgi:hypothetical protein
MCRRTTIGLLALPTILLGCAAPGVAQDLWTEPRCKSHPFKNVGPFARLGDGSLLVIDDNATRVSKDDGKTWSEPRKIYDGPKPGELWVTTRFSFHIALSLQEEDFAGP